MSIKHKTDCRQLTMQSKKVPGTSGKYQNADSGRTNNSLLGMSSRGTFVCVCYIPNSVEKQGIQHTHV